MLKHIVLFKFKRLDNGAERMAAIEKIKNGLLSLEGKVPTLRAIEVGLNTNPNEEYDMVLNTVFDSMEGLAAYAVHPLHREVLALIGALKESRACVDYEF